MMLEFHARDPPVKGSPPLSQLWPPVAITAGLDLARGEDVIARDADPEHPPELIRST